MVPFNELLAWVKAKEAASEEIRVTKILTSDPEAPDHIRLFWSFPATEKGPDGFEDAAGHFYLYRPDKV